MYAVEESWTGDVNANISLRWLLLLPDLPPRHLRHRALFASQRLVQPQPETGGRKLIENFKEFIKSKIFRRSFWIIGSGKRMHHMHAAVWP